LPFAFVDGEGTQATAERDGDEVIFATTAEWRSRQKNPTQRGGSELTAFDTYRRAEQVRQNFIRPIIIITYWNLEENVGHLM